MHQLPPMITATALGAMPQFAMSELGEAATRRALKASGLPPQYLEKREGYIPEHALADFIQQIARGLGEDGLGLLFAPHLTVADYGAWGSYVLSAPDLGTALRRAQQEMHMHSNTDFVRMNVGPHVVSYSYEFGLRGHQGYPDIAYSAVAAILSIMHSYLSVDWSPLRIEFDFSKPLFDWKVEEAFDCPTTFGKDSLRIFFHSHLLSTPRSNTVFCNLVSRQDIVRERMAGPPTSFIKSVRELLSVQLSEQTISLDQAALSLGTSVRSLQRQLNEEGTNFRSLANDLRMQRALELLKVKDATVTKVSTALGYNNTNNFSRAFSNWFGISPRQAQKLTG